MVVPLGIGDIRTIVDDVVKLYQKFKSAHEQIVSMGNEMQTLSFYLSNLESFLNKHPSLTRDAPNETCNLKRTLKEIHSATREVLNIFKEWERNDNLVARAGWAWFGSRPERLRQLSEDINSKRTYLRDWIQLVHSQLSMSVFA